jgi:hypothetical protein
VSSPFTIKTVDSFPAAVSPSADDEFLAYQPHQSPHTRKYTVAQLFQIPLPSLTTTGDATIGGNLVVAGTISGAGGSFLPLTGGAISGALSVAGALSGAGFTNLLAPVSASVSAETSRALAAEALLLPLTGGTLTGALTVGAPGSGVLTFTPGATTSVAPIILSNSSAGLQINGGTTGVSFVGGGPITPNNGVTISRTLSFAAAAYNPPVTFGYTLSGTTTTSDTAILRIDVTDTLGLPNPANDHTRVAWFTQQYGGSTVTGNRVAFQVKSTQTAKSGNLASGSVPLGAFFGAATFAHQQNDTEGGTSLGQAGSYGNIVAGGSVIRTLSTATFMHEVTNWEADMNTAAPSYKKFGWKVTQLPTDVAQGVLDGAYVIENGGTSSNNGWHTGFLAIQPNAQFPYATDGTILNAPLATDFATFNTMAAGIDFKDITFTTAAFRSRNFAVDGLGTVRVGNGYLAKTAAGASLDTTGSIGPAEGATLSGGAIVSGGTTGFVTGQAMYDPYGGVWSVTGAAAGVITQLTCLRTPYFASATPPANPVTLTVYLAAFGNTTGAVTVTMPWTQPTELSLQPGGGTLRAGSGMIAANGSVATVLGSLGPAGSHTTVQEWLAVKNAAGTVRYIPAF